MALAWPTPSTLEGVQHTLAAVWRAVHHRPQRAQVVHSNALELEARAALYAVVSDRIARQERAYTVGVLAGAYLGIHSFEDCHGATHYQTVIHTPLGDVCEAEASDGRWRVMSAHEMFAALGGREEDSAYVW